MNRHTDTPHALGLADLPPRPGPSDYRKAALSLLPHIHSMVPPMGEGQSFARLQFLSTVARQDLGLARLVEGHLDATQILREAGKPAEPDRLYGIWASGGPSDTTVLQTGNSAEPNMRLSGVKPFCSGSDLVDTALVQVYSADQLIAVDMHRAREQQRVRFDEGAWVSSAFAATHTWTVEFNRTAVSADQQIGGANWYFERPGFALGALAPAACWAGGAFGLVDTVRRKRLTNAHARAHLGAMVSALYSMQSMLRWACERADADPRNQAGDIFPTALLVRHQIERGCTEILDRFGRTLGPRPFVFDAASARHIEELTVYIRQCHSEQDLEELGDYVEKHPEFCSDI